MPALEPYPIVPAGKVEPKVTAATAAGAGSSAIVTPFVLWLIDQLFFNGPADPAVPLPVVGVVGLVVAGACTFLGGWLARHVNRLPLA